MLETGGLWHLSKNLKAVTVADITIAAIAVFTITTIVVHTTVLVVTLPIHKTAFTMLAETVELRSVPLNTETIAQEHMQMETVQNIQRFLGKTVYVLHGMQHLLYAIGPFIQEHTTAAVPSLGLGMRVIAAMGCHARHVTHNT